MYLIFNVIVDSEYRAGVVDLVEAVDLLDNVLHLLKRIDTETKNVSSTLLGRLKHHGNAKFGVSDLYYSL